MVRLGQAVFEKMLFEVIHWNIFVPVKLSFSIGIARVEVQSANQKIFGCCILSLIWKTTGRNSIIYATVTFGYVTHVQFIGNELLYHISDLAYNNASGHCKGLLRVPRSYKIKFQSHILYIMYGSVHRTICDASDVFSRDLTSWICLKTTVWRW